MEFFREKINTICCISLIMYNRDSGQLFSLGSLGRSQLLGDVHEFSHTHAHTRTHTQWLACSCVPLLQETSSRAELVGILLIELNFHLWEKMLWIWVAGLISSIWSQCWASASAGKIRRVLTIDDNSCVCLPKRRLSHCLDTQGHQSANQSLWQPYWIYRHSSGTSSLTN